MRHVLVALIWAVAAGCGGLYDKPAAGLVNPRTVKPPKGTAAAPEIVWDETCQTFFHDRPAAVKPDVTGAEHLVVRAQDTAARSSAAEKADQRVALTVRAIEEYKLALGRDPYSAEATYRLAVAYAHVHKKKCALDLIGRLVALKAYPRTAADARRLIEAAYDEPAFALLRRHLP